MIQETMKGDLNLDFLEIDWTDTHSIKIWGRVFENDREW